MEDQARYAVQGRDDHLCLQTYEDSVELWDLPRDVRLAARVMKGVEQLVALPDGCAAHDGREVRLLGLDGERGRVPVDGAPTAIAWSGGRLLVAAGRQAVMLTADGSEIARHPVDVQASALAYEPCDGGDRLLIGYRDGSVELHTLSDESPSRLSLLETPASGVRRALFGPKNTVVLGFANGEVGVWSQMDGSRLAHGHLHGPVAHLLFDPPRLYAASDFGQHLSWDLAPMYRDYCELMAEVWRRVPVLWHEGAPVRMPPPAGHACGR